MGDQDIPPRKQIHELRSYKSNPLDPNYKVAGLSGEKIIIGEIDGQKSFVKN